MGLCSFKRVPAKFSSPVPSGAAYHFNDPFAFSFFYFNECKQTHRQRRALIINTHTHCCILNATRTIVSLCREREKPTIYKRKRKIDRILQTIVARACRSSMTKRKQSLFRVLCRSQKLNMGQSVQREGNVRGRGRCTSRNRMLKPFDPMDGTTTQKKQELPIFSTTNFLEMRSSMLRESNDGE